MGDRQSVSLDGSQGPGERLTRRRPCPGGLKRPSIYRKDVAFPRRATDPPPTVSGRTQAAVNLQKECCFPSPKNRRARKEATMRQLAIVCAVVAVLMLTGCASIVSKSSYPVSFSSDPYDELPSDSVKAAPALEPTDSVKAAPALERKVYSHLITNESVPATIPESREFFIITVAVQTSATAEELKAKFGDPHKIEANVKYDTVQRAGVLLVPETHQGDLWFYGRVGVLVQNDKAVAVVRCAPKQGADTESLRRSMVEAMTIGASPKQ